MEGDYIKHIYIPARDCVKSNYIFQIMADKLRIEPTHLQYSILDQFIPGNLVKGSRRCKFV